MFAQANSEHCRHKIFNASWNIDGADTNSHLFGMIRETHQAQPAGTLVAYDDNAAVIEGSKGGRFMADPATGVYLSTAESINIQIKVETHNHPTAISPFPGAATGSGGEIRDEGATGNGAKPKAGLVASVCRICVYLVLLMSGNSTRVSLNISLRHLRLCSKGLLVRRRLIMSLDVLIFVVTFAPGSHCLLLLKVISGVVITSQS